MALTTWALPSLLAFVLNVFVGIYVLQRNPAGSVNRAFAVWMAFVALWGIGEFFMRISDNAAGGLFWAKFVYLGVFFIGPAYVDFVFKLIGKKFSSILLYLPFALFLPMLATDLFINGASLQPWGYQMSYGVLFPVFGLALFLPLITYAWYVLWKARNAVQKPLVRKKLNLVLYSTILTISFGGITDVILPILGIYVYTVASLLTAVMALSIAYAFTLKE